MNSIQRYLQNDEYVTELMTKYVTGDVLNSNLQDFQNVGLNEILSKPVSLLKLREILVKYGVL